MIVVAIIAILAAVAAPKFGEQMAKSRDARGLNAIGSWRSASQLYYADNEKWAADAFEIYSKNLDEKLKLETSGDLAGADVAASATKLYFVAGTSELKWTADVSEKNIKTDASAVYAKYVTSDGSIAIDTTNKTDSKGKEWSEY